MHTRIHASVHTGVGTGRQACPRTRATPLRIQTRFARPRAPLSRRASTPPRSDSAVIPSGFEGSSWREECRRSQRATRPLAVLPVLGSRLELRDGHGLEPIAYRGRVCSASPPGAPRQLTHTCAHGRAMHGHWQQCEGQNYPCVSTLAPWSRMRHDSGETI